MSHMTIREYIDKAITMGRKTKCTSSIEYKRGIAV